MIILGTNSIKDTGFDVANSCRFNDGSSDDLQKTFGTSTNTDIFTISIWVKRSTLGIDNFFVYSTGGNSDDNWFQVGWNSTDKFVISAYNTVWLRTNRLFRDVSAWYHIVIQADSSQGTASNRLKLYVNGVEETSFSDDNRGSISSSQTWGWNKTGNTGYVGSKAGNNYFDGYMAEVVLLDGNVASPTDFGEFDSDSPTIWKPIDVSGLTFGTNGFYLDFEDSSALGNDAAGSNNFTVNNLTAIDQSTDTCTNNFATWNPLNINDNMGSFVNGNLEYETGGNSFRTAFATFGASQGKWYFECKRITGTSFSIGIISLDYKNITKNVSYIGGAGDATNNIGYLKDGNTSIGGSETSGYAAYGNGETVMVAMDIDNGKVYFGVDGTWGNSGNPESGATGTGAISFTPSGETWTFAVSVYNSHWEANFGSPMYAISSGNTDGDGFGNFEFSVPSGYFSLCTKNLAEYG